MTCVAKAESKLRTGFTKADAKGTCLGDADAALAAAGACATAVGGAVSGDGRCAARKLEAAAARIRAEATCARKAAGEDPGAAAVCLANAEGKLLVSIGRADQQGTCTGAANHLAALIGQCLDTLRPPAACAEAGHPACGGACPAGLACRPFEVFANGASSEAGCSCVDVSNGPPCGGDVCAEDLHCPDPGFVCERWTAGDPLACDHSICQPLCQPNEAAAATCLAMAEEGTDGCTTECPVGTCYVERAGAVTTVFDWINRLNAENFAGHADWRLASEAGYHPTGARELESILVLPCAAGPCIDPIFGPTASARYWSRTADALRSVDAWYVDFSAGGYSNLNKREPLFVRAVR